MANIKLLISGILVLFIAEIAPAQTVASDYAKKIKSAALKKHVYVLASDSLTGRNVGTAGIVKAQNYIVNQWAQSVILRPYFQGEYLQGFSLVCFNPQHIEIKIGETTRNNYEDFIYYGMRSVVDQEYPLVFGGYGYEKDFTRFDATGKAVFLLNNNLRTAVKNADTAMYNGAEFSVVANPNYPEQFQSLAAQLEPFHQSKKCRSLGDTLFKRMEYVVYYRNTIVSSELVEQLTSQTTKYWEQQLKSNYDDVIGKEIGRIKLRVQDVNPDTIQTNNILAYIPGTNTNEYIVVGAHYDHIGIIDGEIHYGADDNASGTAALLEMAGVFSEAYQEGYKPQQNILFIAFSAEEKGMIGAKYFVDNFENPDSIKLMINLDMIGRCGYTKDLDCRKFYFVADNLADSIMDLNTELCERYKLEPEFTSNINGSDHAPFKDKGIPTIFYFNGLHNDYHKPTDTKEKIDYQKMTRIARVAFETIWNQSGIRQTN